MPGIILNSDKYTIVESLFQLQKKQRTSSNTAKRTSPRMFFVFFLKLKAATKVKWSMPNPLNRTSWKCPHAKSQCTTDTILPAAKTHTFRRTLENSRDVERGESQENCPCFSSLDALSIALRSGNLTAHPTSDFSLICANTSNDAQYFCHRVSSFITSDHDT